MNQTPSADSGDGVAKCGISLAAPSAAGDSPTRATDPAPGNQVSFRDAFVVWCRIAALSFGGPAGQIAVMHRILVDEKRWVSEDRFLHALNFCMLLPGPEAQQLATYFGWLLHRVKGGLTAGLLFIMPGFLSIMLLSVLYAEFQTTILVTALFFGLKPAVMAVVVEALLRIGKRVLKNRLMFVIAGVSFLALFLFDIPFPVIVACAAAVGYLTSRRAPHRLRVAEQAAGQATSESASGNSETVLREIEQPGAMRTFRTLVVCVCAWVGPLLLLPVVFPDDPVFQQEGEFFSKTAVVTFGGAYGVLAYIKQQAVETFGWLKPPEMLDGLGMAETTPGPLIMVVQFVGFMGGYRHAETVPPVWGGVIGATVTTWATFAPCFLWIFLGGPYVELVRRNVALSAAMKAITASVVGVILNLAIWFSLHTLFADVQTITFSVVRIPVPVFASIHQGAVGIAVVAAVLIFRYRRGMLVTLPVCCLLGLIWALVNR